MGSIIDEEGKEYLNHTCHYITEGIFCAKDLMGKWMSVKFDCHRNKMKNINIKEKLRVRLTRDNKTLSRL